MKGLMSLHLPRPAAARIAVVVALHVALLWLAMRPVHNPVTRQSWLWVPMLRLLPPASLPGKPSPVPAAQPHAGRSTPARPDAARERVSSVPAAAIEPAPTPPEDSPEERALLAAPPSPATTTPPRPDAVQQALKAVGAIDKQLRAEHPQQFTAPPDTLRARLIKGLAAAHAAVGPKWFESARTELISAPDDPKRIYRVTTAMGEYCLYFPDKGGISANADPKSGWAGFGQPTMSSCPIPF